VLCCACRDLNSNNMLTQGAAALAPALYALTVLSELRLMRDNGCSLQSLAEADRGSSHPLCPLLKALRVDLEGGVLP
jgi:hypothetical protein